MFRYFKKGWHKTWVQAIIEADYWFYFVWDKSVHLYNIGPVLSNIYDDFSDTCYFNYVVA